MLGEYVRYAYINQVVRKKNLGSVTKCKAVYRVVVRIQTFKSENIETLVKKLGVPLGRSQGPYRDTSMCAAAGAAGEAALLGARSEPPFPGESLAMNRIHRICDHPLAAHDHGNIFSEIKATHTRRPRGVIRQTPLAPGPTVVQHVPPGIFPPSTTAFFLSPCQPCFA
jgi:hypothetical protein